MTEWMSRILESKRAARKRLRELSFADKVKLLEKLRQRSLAIAASPLRQRARQTPLTATVREP